MIITETPGAYYYSAVDKDWVPACWPLPTEDLPIAITKVNFMKTDPIYPADLAGKLAALLREKPDLSILYIVEALIVLEGLRNPGVCRTPEWGDYSSKCHSKGYTPRQVLHALSNGPFKAEWRESLTGGASAHWSVL